MQAMVVETMYNYLMYMYKYHKHRKLISSNASSMFQSSAKWVTSLFD